jgi:4-diphosphocytidyl-2-C-methyl-D-erythritol kinase
MPAAVTERAPAKVNLSLHVLGRRADGYHNLDSVVAFADIADELSFAKADRFELIVTGPFAADVPLGADNLVVRAADALSDACGRSLTQAHITLGKNLPVASGLGGGSADAAATLRGLTKLFGIDCSCDALNEIAAVLGSDVPACLRARACRIRGAGEIVEPLAVFRSLAAVLVNPGIRLSTAAVFGELSLSAGSGGGGPHRNDLKEPAIRLAPVIGEVLAELKGQQGLERAGMSGSGATCFGLFPSADLAEEASRRITGNHPNWWCRATMLG